MKAHYLQHVPFEGLGCMEPWLREHCTSLTATQLYAGEILPAVEDFDLLVVMGGPMGVGDDDQYPWLTDEKRFLSSAIAAGKTVLGICLGAQLIAKVLGAPVTRNPEPEIGWFPVARSTGAANSRVGRRLPEHMTVLHWHGDTFAIPSEAVPLYSSEACANQGFVIEERVVGLQFHLESTPDGLQALVENCRNELLDAPYIQSEAALLAAGNPWSDINAHMITLLEALVDGTP